MKHKNNEIWEGVKAKLVETTSAAGVWLEETELVRFDESVAVIFVPSDFKRVVVSERFGDRIAMHLARLRGKPVRVRFVGKDEFFSVTPEEREEAPAVARLKKLTMGFREASEAMDRLIAQLNCVIEEIADE